MVDLKDTKSVFIFEIFKLLFKIYFIILGVCIFNLHVCLCTTFMPGPVKVLNLHVSAENKPGSV